MENIKLIGNEHTFVDYGVYSGKYNMEKDSELLDEAIKNQYKIPIFRLYGWKPACISLGRNQSEAFMDKEILSKYGIDCVRRLTGGRALLHDKELTYSYICPVSIVPNGDNVLESYKYISEIWINIFSKMGIELTIGGLKRHISKNNYCMAISTGADLCYKGKKFIGSAQCRKNGYILQHGSILLDYNPEILDKIFNEKTDYSSIISLKEIDSDITIDDIRGIILNNRYASNNL